MGAATIPGVGGPNERAEHDHGDGVKNAAHASRAKRLGQGRPGWGRIPPDRLAEDISFAPDAPTARAVKGYLDVRDVGLHIEGAHRVLSPHSAPDQGRFFGFPIMSKVFAVLGAGMQGTALAYDLAKYADPAKVILADVSGAQAQSSASRVNGLLGGSKCDAAQVDALDEASLVEFLRGVDVLASCVPY